MRRRTRIPASILAALLAAPTLAGAATEVRTQQIDGLDVVVVVDDGSDADIDTTRGIDSGTAQHFAAVQSAGGATPGTGCFAVDPNTVGCNGDFDAVIVFGNGGDDRIEMRLITDGLPPLHGEAYGGDGNDTLDALHDNRDVPQPESYLDGEGGDDTINGSNGADEIHGGDGNDEVMAWEGGDFVYGEAGDDNVRAGNEQPDANVGDVLDGGPGFDEIPAAGGDYNRSVNDEVSVSQDGQANDGEPGEGDNVTNVEKLRLEGNRATFVGSDAAEDVFVDADFGTLRGNGGNDRLVAYDGHDTIDGGDGDDYLEGGFGNDELTGGPGVDQFSGDRTETDVIAIGSDKIFARDGIAEQVNCGIGSDTAQVDAGDVVDLSCESVDRSAPSPSPGPLSPPPPPRPPCCAPRPDRLEVALARSGRLPRLGAALRDGLTFTVNAERAGDVRVVLIASGRFAAMARTKVIATGSKRVAAPGKVKVRVRFTRKARRRYRRLRSLPLTARATLGAGRARATSQLKLTLRR